MRAERPDAVLILGDTNSSIAAVMAKRLRIPVYHMEAGNRCFDENVPEETNRRLVDHVADFNLVYTEHARRNLLAEGLHPRRILLTGSPMREVLEHYRDRDRRLGRARPARARARVATSWSAPTGRRTSTRRCGCGCSWTACRPSVPSGATAWSSRLTRARARGSRRWTGSPRSDGIDFMEPFGFHDYNRLQLDAACVLSDSGTISEESSILGFPAVTLRDSIERPEALDSGSIIMTGLDVEDVTRAVSLTMADEVAGRPSRPATRSSIPAAVWSGSWSPPRRGTTSGPASVGDDRSSPDRRLEPPRRRRHPSGGVVSQ